MKQGLTEIIFILDRSGSMSGLEGDTIGGYNSFLDSQRNTPGEAKVTTILFDDKYEILHNYVDIRDIRPITDKEYFARGNTALLDAVGRTINDVGARLSDTDESERPEKIIFVITTDGQENSSKRFTYPKIHRMITHQREKYNWEFLFLGANIDAAQEAKQLGISQNRSAQYVSSAIGTASLFSTVADSISFFRKTGKVQEGWDKDLGSDSEKKKPN